MSDQIMMEMILTWSLLLLVGVLIPQAIGFFAIHKTRNHSLVLRIFVPMIPAIVFFLLSSAFWGMAATGITESGQRICGGFAGVSLIVTALGVVMNLVLGIALQVIMSARGRMGSKLPN
jgi:hypothetical protein